MNSNERVRLVLELLDGNVTAAQLAHRNGLTEQELLAWRDTWLAGARAATKTRAPNRRLLILGGLAAVAVLGLVTKEALAASCTTPGSYSVLGLRYFCANDPAIAADVNANTMQLVGLMQQKLGSSWGQADAGAGTSGISTSSASIGGPATITGAATITGGATIGSTANVSFGSQTRQMLNLYGTQYGIGVQGSTLYARSGGNFAWYVGGSHSDTAFDPGPGGVEAMRLTANGALSVRGLKQVNGGGLTVAPAELQRLIVEAGPSVVGVAVPIDQGSLVGMCGDDDGCQYTISMVNWAGDGNVSSRSGMFFMSQTTGAWRLENDIEGVDSNNGVTETSAWDCYFGDFNFSSDANNGRLDNGTGFGLLNCKGCTYSDSTTTCRMVFRD